MTRAAIYARYSTDRQSQSSIDDQVSLCRAYADRRGWTVAGVYADAARSGSSTEGREDFARMIADAELHACDLILAEDIDRLSRNLSDIERFRERMEFIGVAIHTVADGEVSQMHAALKGLTSAIFIKGHAQRMRGRMAEIARKGQWAGGNTFGYEAGPVKGTRIVNEAEAVVVRRIFEEYVEPWLRSPRDIAARLNADGVPAPRGRDWLASAINGNAKRGSGILHNTLYDGRQIYNRVAMRKAPGTNRRVSRVNPQSEWIEVAVSKLRIVPEELFAAASAIKAERSKSRPEQSRRPRHMLAGLLRCGTCGSGMAINNGGHAGRRIGCGRRKEGGRCSNGRTYKLAPIEHRVVAALKANLTDPRAIERYLMTYHAERKRLAAAESGKRSAAERALAVTQREIERIVEGVAKGTLEDAEVRARMAPLRERRDSLEAEIASLPQAQNVVALHPQTVRRYLDAVNDLAVTLARRVVEGHDTIAKALRELVVTVTVHPEGDTPRLEVEGRLAMLTNTGLFPRVMISPTVVAGDRTRRWRKPEDVFRFVA